MVTEAADTAAEADWPRLEAALDALIDLDLDAPEARAAALDRLASGNLRLRARLAALAAALDPAPTRLDSVAAASLCLPGSGDAPGLAPGILLGPWRITGWLGAGGMGEVQRAERADGQFEREVAIKLVRADARDGGHERFQREREIVAALEHTGIARLFDGGIAPDGRPYMVMELVDGEPIGVWCKKHTATLEQRLALFEQVAEAVAYAHRHLVVHRDLKPANVLVTPEGRARLLDFGVARWLKTPVGDATREPMLTAAYASPEQLAGGPVTTATDVYALGLLLFELLVGRPAFDVQQLPSAAALQQVMTVDLPPASRAAAAQARPPVPPARLAGDLDAIVAKAVRREPEARYAGVDALLEDLRRHRRHEPVLARRGRWTYVAGRALRRHRVPAAAGLLALAALLGGAGLAGWQARKAQAEATRANAVKSYLLQIFKASDPRRASDQPRGSITARELLDLGAARIDKEFAGQPALHIELQGALATLYRELGETARYEDLQARRLALAAREHDERALAEVWLNRAADADDDGKRDAAQAPLHEADAALRRGGLDDTPLRARWWLSHAQSLPPADLAGRARSLRTALRLYERLDPQDPGRVTVLIETGLLAYDRSDHEAAVSAYREAEQAFALARDGDDGEQQTLYGNLSIALMALGRWDEAVTASQKGLELARRTYGEAHADYWVPAARFARLLDLGGDREAARALIDPLFDRLPRPWTGEAWKLIETLVDIRVEEGDGAATVELAQSLWRQMLAQPHSPSAERRARLRLGEALWQAGRLEPARAELRDAYEAFAAAEAPHLQTRLAATEVWARFLLQRGEAARARPLLEAVVAQDKDRHLAHVALALADLADVALTEGRAAAAMQLSADAQARWAAVRGFRDVRMGQTIALARARVLMAVGDLAAARPLAEGALAQSLRTDVAAAPSIADARGLVKRLAVGP